MDQSPPSSELSWRGRFAAVECGIGQCFLKSDKDVDLLAFVGAVFLDEGHHRLAHSHYGFRVSREGELPGDRLLLHGLMAFRQANTSRAMRSWPSPRPSLKSRQRAPQHRQVSRDKQPEEPTVSLLRETLLRISGAIQVLEELLEKKSEAGPQEVP